MELKISPAKKRCLKELEESHYLALISKTPEGDSYIVGVDINFIRIIKVRTVKKYLGDQLRKKREIQNLINLPVPTNCRKELWIWSQSSKRWTKNILTEN